jgi:hypothetical protein
MKAADFFFNPVFDIPVFTFCQLQQHIPYSGINAVQKENEVIQGKTFCGRGKQIQPSHLQALKITYIFLFVRRVTPTIVPCRKAFEPKKQGGRLVVSLGFSVLAEPAHQNQ